MTVADIQMRQDKTRETKDEQSPDLSLPPSITGEENAATTSAIAGVERSTQATE